MKGNGDLVERVFTSFVGKYYFIDMWLTTPPKTSIYDYEIVSAEHMAVFNTESTVRIDESLGIALCSFMGDRE